VSSVTTDPPAGGPGDPAGPPAPGAAPLTHRDVPLHRAEGVTLLGAMAGSGYRTPPALARRADGQTVQLTALLYAVLDAVDGRRTPAQVAEKVSRATGRPVSEDNVWTLVETQLRPLGLLRLADGSEPEVRKSNPLLGLRMKYVVSDPERTRRLTAPFAVLFAPVVVAVVTLAFLAVSGWVLFDKGLAAATHEAFQRPGLLLLVFLITIVSAGFHEFGHAAACRYGGATPGVMGAGLYLVWPAFYTEVTDSYRLDRTGRVRVDLGGLYFNAIVALAMFGLWAAIRFDALLLVIATQVLQMIRQLAPFVRYDGYHILADLTGVPDLFAHIKPTLKGLLPTRWGQPEGRVLKTWARAVVSVWVLTVVPLLLAALALMVLALPRLAGTAWAGLDRQWGLLGDRVAAGDGVGITLRILSIVALALPVLASVYLLVRLVRQAVGGVWRWTDGRPGRRAVAGVSALALVAGLAWAWWPRPEAYRPIQPTERGTVVDAVPAALIDALPAPVRDVLPVTEPTTPSGEGLREGEVAAAQTLWAGDSEPPPKDEPVLALVLVPRDAPAGVPDAAEADAAAPVWVFPFDRPAPPGPGDNQALAVNTTDGSTLYEVAFALVWADDGAVLNRNEAYAFASCRGCTTVAVAFQVVLVLGEADVVIPQNLAAAANYSCVACVTYALAQQLVVALPGELSPAAMAEVEALWQQIAAYGADLRSVPLDQVRAQLTEFERQILDVVARDIGAAPATGSTASATATAPSASDAPSAAPTATPAPAGTSATPSTSDTTTPTGSPSPTDSPTPTTSASPTP